MQPSHEINEFGQPIGWAVEGWSAPTPPFVSEIRGTYCRLESLDSVKHGVQLFNALQTDSSKANWTYLPYGPYQTYESFVDWIMRTTGSDDPYLYAIIDLRTGEASGIAGYLRNFIEDGTIEVGHLNFAGELKQSSAATEAMYLMMRNVFESGYRRYEWKCNALNLPSRRAAQRLGFSFEGVWRQAKVVKGRNRDTAWFSVSDKDWPTLNRCFQTWLSGENFDHNGQQKVSLSALTRPVIEKVDPAL